MKFVKIPGKDFEISIYQCTQNDWELEMRKNPSHFIGDVDRPVECVSWNDVQEFIKKMNNNNDGYVYRLPTEEEWEFCCRAGSTTDFCFGDSEAQLNNYAWFYKNSDNKTHPVGEKNPNGFGLYDMHGNVWEWCSDVGHGSYRVLRGGSWDGFAQYLRSAYRSSRSPGYSYNDVGFRLVRTACNSLSSYTLTDLKQKMWRAYRAKARREFNRMWKEIK
jgi:formylglycine-generating enzyme required for sulfatase activity